MPGERKTTSRLLEVIARCHTCDWTWDNHTSPRTRRAEAAAHAKNSGHFVSVEVTRLIDYNRPTPERPRAEG